MVLYKIIVFLHSLKHSCEWPCTNLQQLFLLRVCNCNFLLTYYYLTPGAYLVCGYVAPSNLLIGKNYHGIKKILDFECSKTVAINPLASIAVFIPCVEEILVQRAWNI